MFGYSDMVMAAPHVVAALPFGTLASSGTQWIAGLLWGVMVGFAAIAVSRILPARRPHNDHPEAAEPAPTMELLNEAA